MSNLKKPRAVTVNLKSKELKESKELDKEKAKKQRFENYKIDEGIELIILNTKVEKARKNIFGNFLYKINNNSHYEVKAILDLSNSDSINIKQLQQKDLIFQLDIDPFTSSDNTVEINSFSGKHTIENTLSILKMYSNATYQNNSDSKLQSFPRINQFRFRREKCAYLRQ